MRALVVALLVACSSGRPAPSATQLEVRVDRRVELLAIVQRLSGHRAYQRTPNAPYVLAAERWFRPFADHPAIAATRALQAQHSISWDAPMTLAVHLDDQLRPHHAGELATLDPRFTRVDVEAYAAQLRAFAADARLDAFLAEQRDHLTYVERALRTIVEREQVVAWFDTMFGKRPKTRYVVVAGALTGTMNFGVRATATDGVAEIYQVMGIASPLGYPPTDDAFVGLLVHELAHAYINPAFAAHRATLEPAGTKLFARVEGVMRRQAYGDWATVLNESAVRALTVLYLEKRAPSALAAEEQLGFTWTKELADVLRDLPGSSIDALMPRIVGVFERASG